MTIKDICSNNEVIYVSREASIEEASRLMKQHNIGAIPVVDSPEHSRKPCGILTDRDLVTKVFVEGIEPRKLSIADVMTQNPLTVRENEGLFQAIRHLSEKGVRRALVVDDSGKLVGIVSIDDFIVLVAKELNCIGELIKKQCVDDSKCTFRSE